MTLLSLEKDPIIKISEKGWETCFISATTLVACIKPVILWARHALTDDVLSHFVHEGIFLRKRLEVIQSLMESGTLTPEVFERIISGLTGFKTKNLEEEPGSSREALARSQKKILATDIERRIFRVDAAIKTWIQNPSVA